MGKARLLITNALLESLLGFPEGHKIEGGIVGKDMTKVHISGPYLPEPNKDGSLKVVNGEVSKSDPCDKCWRYHTVITTFK